MSHAEFFSIIRDRFRKICADKRSFTLIEKQNQGKRGLSEVTITGFTEDDAVKFCFDRKDRLSPYLATGNHQKKCDAVILTKYKGEIYLIFIEMKSAKYKKGNAKKQFQSSECFLDYCASIVKKIKRSDLLVTSKKRFVVIRESLLVDKRKIRADSVVNTPRHDCPDTALEVLCAEGGRVQLGRLL